MSRYLFSVDSLFREIDCFHGGIAKYAGTIWMLRSDQIRSNQINPILAYQPCVQIGVLQKEP